MNAYTDVRRWCKGRRRRKRRKKKEDVKNDEILESTR